MASPPELWRGVIERLGWGGHGLARAADGRMVLLRAPLALVPGEEVEALVEWKARHGEGEVLRWLRGDERRVPPACPYAQRCGGCSLWGVDAGLRGELKRAMAADLLHRMLPGAPEWEWLAAPPEARRSRIQLHWDGSQLGYFARGTHELIAVDCCPIAQDALSQTIPQLAAALRSGDLPAAPARWELATGTPPALVAASAHGQTWWFGAPPGLKPGATTRLLHQLGEAPLRQHPRAFFQVTPQWAWAAFGRVFAAWGLGGRKLYDLYGGGGFFTLLLAERFAQFEVVEAAPLSVSDAHLNLDQLGDAAQVREADVATALPQQPAGLARPADVLLLDPPRSGLPPAVSAWLGRSQAGKVVLIGCDGAAFCRDVRRICEEGKRRLTRLAVIDLFPNTPDVECVGLLERYGM
jgi:23S rRNA (uracil1939-C5)-methyltransferase